MDLYIDLSKGKINTSRLVKRPIQVKGKNGKVFTLMQWVDPKTGEPVSKQHAHIESHENTKKTQKEHIDDHVKNMSREDKYHHLGKHDIKWKHNDHPAIDHKNAVGALKEHFYKNPHLAGAEHLDNDDAKTPEGDDKVNDWASKYTGDRDKLYKLMHHAGVIPTPDDPKDNPEWASKADGGNGSAPIRHMRNLMAFKKHLKENPHKMGEYDNHPDFGMEDSPKSSGKIAEKPKPNPVKSKAEQGGNTIQGVLKNMSRKELYDLAIRLNITDRDPAENPEWGPKPTGNGSAPIRHMKIVMALKKEIEKDPSILNLGENGELSDQEKERLNNRGEDELLKDKIQDFVKGMSKELKLEWAEKYKDNAHMKSRIKSDTEHIDNMHKVSALKKILADNPELMDKGELKDAYDKEQLRNLKIGNKAMQKLLFHVVGLKNIGDVKSEERGVEWSFGVASFARIEEDDDGNMILSVVDCGKEGEDWNEHQFPLEQVKKYIDGLKSGSESTLKSKEIPLHKKPIPDIWKALNEDFDKNYTAEAGNVLKKNIYEAWVVSGRRNSAYAISKHMDGHSDTLKSLLDKFGVSVSGNNISTDDDSWRKTVYSHLIDKEKSKHASEYIQKWKGAMFGEPMVDTWVLHESAKHWTPDERTKARKELIKDAMKVPDTTMKDKGDREIKLVHHTHRALEFVPFDLMTDVIAHGCKFDFTGIDSDGKKRSGSYYSDYTKTVHLDSSYFHDNSVLTASNPMDHVPEPTTNADGSRTFRNPIGDTHAHEFAHAIDHFLSGHEGFMDWTNSKYAGSNPNVVTDSYASAVERSNPNKYVGVARNGSTPYVFHKDEWMSAYEGRIYHPGYYTAGVNQHLLVPDATKKEHTDAGWNTHFKMRGLEHWSENSSRYATALHMYKKWQKENDNPDVGVDEWAKNMHDDFLSMGYGDESNDGETYTGSLGKVMLKSYRAKASHAMRMNPMEGYGYLYHRMSKIHPELHQAMHEIYGRGDFVGSKTPTMKESYEKGDYTRKSELVIYL